MLTAAYRAIPALVGTQGHPFLNSHSALCKAHWWDPGPRLLWNQARMVSGAKRQAGAHSQVLPVDPGSAAPLPDLGRCVDRKEAAAFGRPHSPRGHLVFIHVFLLNLRKWDEGHSRIWSTMLSDPWENSVAPALGTAGWGYMGRCGFLGKWQQVESFLGRVSQAAGLLGGHPEKVNCLKCEGSQANAK